MWQTLEKGYFMLGYQKLHVSVTCPRAASDDQFNGRGGGAFLLFRCRVIKEEIAYAQVN